MVAEGNLKIKPVHRGTGFVTASVKERLEAVHVLK
jgi:hypothetical protein